MSNRITWTGLEEFKTWLATLPTRLVEGGQVEAEWAANAAKAEIYAAYPFRSGKMRDALRVLPTKRPTPYRVRVTLSNPSPLSHLIERGTEARHTSLGIDRGKMLPKHVFLPRLIRWRQRMYDADRVRLEAEGFKVSGEF